MDCRTGGYFCRCRLEFCRIVRCDVADAPHREIGVIDRVRVYGPLIVLWLVATSFNLFKPFHIDDSAHLLIAQWISQNPLHPASGMINWIGIDAPIHKTNQPHLYFYLLALWGSLFGYGPFAMHVLQSFFSLACILLFHHLASRWTKAPLLLVACFALNPVFIVSQNLMMDVPLLAFWLGFFLLLTRVDSRDRRSDVLFAACLCAAACLIKYTSLVLIPILGLALIVERRFRDLWALFIPLAALLAWSLFNYWDYGGIHILERPSSDAPGSISMINLIILCGAFCPVFFWGCPVQWRPSLRMAVALLPLFIFASLWAVSFIANRFANGALLVFCVTSGVLVLIGLVFSLRQNWIFAAGQLRIDVVLIWLWLMATAVFLVFLSPFMAARHFLLVLPALLLLFVGRMAREKSLSIRLILPATLAFLSLCMSLADHRFAATIRDQVDAIRLAYPHHTIWVDGHWGLQWYAMEAGLNVFDWMQSRPAQGDVIILADADGSIDRHATSGWTWDRAFSVSDHARPEFCPIPPALFYGSIQVRPPWYYMGCLSDVDAYRVEAQFKPAIHAEKIRQAGSR